VQLEFRPPLAWPNLLAYLKLRAIPGVEWADATHYFRTVSLDGATGWLAVTHAPGAVDALALEMSPSLARVSAAVVARVARLFDLGAVPEAVSAALERDALLAPTVRRLPGLRVAGAFDGFELAVRAVLGQQISVKGASTVAGRWASALGVPITTPYPQLNRLAPTADVTAAATTDCLAALGMVGSRARCLGALARAVAEGSVNLSVTHEAEPAAIDAQIDGLMSLPGIGPWTANYIAMRALQWRDAFPDGDLMLMRAAQATRKQLQARAEGWRPWRAYAAHYLWQSL
jgi:AraC family transcriptional regulator of adaptative response / DNA-3-methyladenine glycosylase II